MPSLELTTLRAGHSAAAQRESLDRRDLILADLGHRKVSTDLSSQVVADFVVAGNCLDRAGLRIGPKGVSGPFALERTAVSAQVL